VDANTVRRPNQRLGEHGEAFHDERVQVMFPEKLSEKVRHELNDYVVLCKPLGCPICYLYGSIISPGVLLSFVARSTILTEER
jgi:hypothetical protein